MSIAKIMSTHAAGKLDAGTHASVSFKSIMNQKKVEQEAAVVAEANKVPADLGVNNAAKALVNSHESAIKTVKTVMTRTDYSPERLLKIQYETGVLFLREQMLCKTAELSANTFKNFTQMQI